MRKVDIFRTHNCHFSVGPLNRNDGGRRKVKGKGTQGVIRRRRPGLRRHDIKRQFTQRHEVRKPVTSQVTSLRTEDSDKAELRPRSWPFIENGGWKPIKTTQ